MIKRILKRSLFYYRNGSSLLTMPLSFLGWASAIFYLAIDHIPTLKIWFPSFTSFLIIGGLILVVTCALCGYIYVKRSFFYSTDIQVQREADPHAYTLAPGRDTAFNPSVLLFAQLIDRIAERHNLYASEEERKTWKDYLNMLSYMKQGGDLRNYNKVKQ